MEYCQLLNDLKFNLQLTLSSKPEHPGNLFWKILISIFFWDFWEILGLAKRFLKKLIWECLLCYVYIDNFLRVNLGTGNQTSLLFVLWLRFTTLNPLHHCFKLAIYTGSARVAKRTDRVQWGLTGVSKILSEYAKNTPPNKRTLRTMKIFPLSKIPNNWTLLVIFKWILAILIIKSRVHCIIQKKKT